MGDIRKSHPFTLAFKIMKELDAILTRGWQISIWKADKFEVSAHWYKTTPKQSLHFQGNTTEEALKQLIEALSNENI